MSGINSLSSTHHHSPLLLIRLYSSEINVFVLNNFFCVCVCGVVCNLGVHNTHSGFCLSLFFLFSRSRSLYSLFSHTPPLAYSLNFHFLCSFTPFLSPNATTWDPNWQLTSFGFLSQAYDCPFGIALVSAFAQRRIFHKFSTRCFRTTVAPLRPPATG